jgi:hypothetical protein
MAPFDFNEFEERMNRVTRQIENGFSNRAKSFENKMEEFRKRMERASKRAKLRSSKIDIPNIDAMKINKDESIININGTKITIKDGKLTIASKKRVTNKTKHSTKLLRLYLAGWLLAVIICTMVIMVHSLMTGRSTPKPLDVNPLTIEQTIPSAEEHPEIVLKKKL